jgi:hypothetical protein
MDPENREFLGPEMATSEIHVHKIWRLDLNDFDAGKSNTQTIGRGGAL